MHLFVKRLLKFATLLLPTTGHDNLTTAICAVVAMNEFYYMAAGYAKWMFIDDNSAIGGDAWDDYYEDEKNIASEFRICF